MNAGENRDLMTGRAGPKQACETTWKIVSSTNVLSLRYIVISENWPVAIERENNKEEKGEEEWMKINFALAFVQANESMREIERKERRSRMGAKLRDKLTIG